MKWRVETSGSDPTLYRVPGDPSQNSWKTREEAGERAAALESDQKARDKKFRNW